MAKSIDPAMLAMVKSEWAGAGFGYRTQVIEKWAKLLDVSKQTLYKAVDTGRKRTGKRLIDGIEEAALIVAQIKSRPPEHRGQLTTQDAVDIAVTNKLITEGLAHVATFDRIIRELGANKQRRRIERFQAEFPNEMHHVDASSSNCFYVQRALPDGDYVLKIYGGTKDYKNKPVPIRLRPWIYGLADDHSGFHIARYVAALGESAADNLDFLCWVWSQIGLPKKIKGDHGPMMSSDGIPEWFDRLGIEIDPSEVLNKDAHGKIERPWRTMWQRFELPFFAESEWKKFEITLSELNKRFARYQEDYNSKPHRFERTITRRQAWQRVNLHGGIVTLPENALKTIVRRWSRKLGQDGCFSIDNEIFEVKGLHDAWVWVYKGMFEEKTVVVDQSTGTKYEVTNFVPNKLDEYSEAPESAYQKVRKESAKLEGIHNTLYTEDKMAPAKVRQIPTRVKEVRTIENPLDLDRYASVQEAIAEFQTLTGIILARGEREDVAELIRENGMSRRYVVGLAAEVQAELGSVAM
jgi:hypothetical protein